MFCLEERLRRKGIVFPGDRLSIEQALSSQELDSPSLCASKPPLPLEIKRETPDEVALTFAQSSPGLSLVGK